MWIVGRGNENEMGIYKLKYLLQQSEYQGILGNLGEERGGGEISSKVL